jgi:hypothetical protein
MRCSVIQSENFKGVAAFFKFVLSMTYCQHVTFTSTDKNVKGMEGDRKSEGRREIGYKIVPGTWNILTIHNKVSTCSKDH